MSNAEGIARVALALDAERRASAYTARRATWAEDYGPGRHVGKMAAQGLDDGLRRLIDAAGYAVGEGRVDDFRGLPRQTLWSKVRATFCPGTMVFIACAGIAAFIVVV